MNRTKFFKVWHGLPERPVLGLMAQKAGVSKAAFIGVWVALLDYASRQPKDRGTIKNIDSELLACSLGLTQEEVQSIMQRLWDYNWLEGDKIVRWVIEQPSSTERVRKMRKERVGNPVKAKAALTPAQQQANAKRLQQNNGSMLGINSLR